METFSTLIENEAAKAIIAQTLKLLFEYLTKKLLHLLNSTSMSKKKVTPLPVVAELIRYRKEIGWSQTELAQYFSMERPAWAKIENYQVNPSVQIVRKAAKLLGKQMEELC